MQHQQKGLSSIGLVVALAVAIISATLAVKMVPDYLEYYQLKSIFNGLAEEPDIRDTTPSAIRLMLSKRLQVNGIRDFNIDKDTFIGVDNGLLVLEFDYEKQRHIFANIDVLMKFDYSREIK